MTLVREGSMTAERLQLDHGGTMQTLIECGAPAIGGWVLSNVFVVIGWCWSCSRRRRRMSNDHQTCTILQMPSNFSRLHLRRPAV
jgi:hypothetical protein